MICCKNTASDTFIKGRVTEAYGISDRSTLYQDRIWRFEVVEDEARVLSCNPNPARFLKQHKKCKTDDREVIIPLTHILR